MSPHVVGTIRAKYDSYGFCRRSRVGRLLLLLSRGSSLPVLVAVGEMRATAWHCTIESGFYYNSASGTWTLLYLQQATKGYNKQRPVWITALVPLFLKPSHDYSNLSQIMRVHHNRNRYLFWRLSLGFLCVLQLLLPANLCVAMQSHFVGPGGGGSFFQPTVSPLDSKRVLVASDMTGGYFSDNRGEHWHSFSLRGPIWASPPKSWARMRLHVPEPRTVGSL